MKTRTAQINRESHRMLEWIKRTHGQTFIHAIHAALVAYVAKLKGTP